MRHDCEKLVGARPRNRPGGPAFGQSRDGVACGGMPGRVLPMGVHEQASSSTAITPRARGRWCRGSPARTRRRTAGDNPSPENDPSRRRNSARRLRRSARTRRSPSSINARSEVPSRRATRRASSSAASDSSIVVFIVVIREYGSLAPYYHIIAARLPVEILL